jgi:nanoRNase/pAp phosphatase (c-di-AMP/oligoRNAs hydrolase)
MSELRRPLGSVRLDRLLGVLGGAAGVAVVTHDNPDPDAVAASWGFVSLAEHKLGCPGRIYAGGAITRAENRAMVELLKPPLDLVAVFEPPAGFKVVVVDTQHPARLQRFDPRQPVAAVVDHHEHEGALAGSRTAPRLRTLFRDVRPQAIACSSIAASYLRAAGIAPDSSLATALLYGIHTDAKGQDASFSRIDRAAIAWLSQYSDPDLRSQIERAPLPREYFADLLVALENAVVYEDAAVCFLPSAAGSELVGEMADLLLRCSGIHRVLCAAVVDSRVVFSARTSSGGGDAALFLREALGPLGSCGGHKHRAGGYVDLGEVDVPLPELELRLRERFLGSIGISDRAGTKLVCGKELLKVGG